MFSKPNKSPNQQHKDRSARDVAVDNFGGAAHRRQQHEQGGRPREDPHSNVPREGPVYGLVHKNGSDSEESGNSPEKRS
ncbi:hypothetical protein CNMCM5793_004440 [Aspergillus hiratsukae]|uniref:Uncharacterized protein n=1 Tax=Aspergillus hiratsukae TaxID=1194566 RepID=A0A8H6QGY8_9EURO|nr:hypothetical protein CNMCM5793_004440 [Aspergillus hiratsukae]KAF7172479.1 hypothetical protein CNMCM6106_006669 [Aspergillus hiratsukae]